MEEEINDVPSVFVEYFGSSPYIKILDFLLTGQDFDYAMTEIARGAGVGWSAFTIVWKKLLEKNIIVSTRTIGNAKLFKLNKKNLFVQKIIKLDAELTKLETNKILKESMGVVRVKS